MTAEPETLTRGMDDNVSWLVVDTYGLDGDDLKRLMRVRAMMEPRNFWFEGLSARFDAGNWMQAPRKAALNLIEDANRRGVAHHPGGMPDGDLEPTEAFALFASRFEPDARFYVTNLVRDMELSNPTPSQIDILDKLAQFGGMTRYFEPFTAAPIDCALGVVDARQAGIFCIEDTD